MKRITTSGGLTIILNEEQVSDVVCTHSGTASRYTCHTSVVAVVGDETMWGKRWKTVSPHLGNHNLPHNDETSIAEYLRLKGLTEQEIGQFGLPIVGTSCKTTCPVCRAVLVIPETSLGEKLRCGCCSRLLKVPEENGWLEKCVE